jgi:hypothetical protein
MFPCAIWNHERDFSDFYPEPISLYIRGMDFSQDELLDVIERLVGGLLERAGATTPPVDALHIAEEHLGLPVEVVEPAEEDDTGRRRPRRRGNREGIQLSPEMTPEQQQKIAADGIARLLLPDVLRKLGVAPGTENKPVAAQIRGLIVPRILVPTRLLRAAPRECKYDLLALKELFATATEEMIALRFLDLDSPCVIAIVDDGVVAVRRGNRFPVTKKLESAEQVCHDRVAALELPQRVRVAEWMCQGWPIAQRRFRRIILRSMRDDDV